MTGKQLSSLDSLAVERLDDVSEMPSVVTAQAPGSGHPVRRMLACLAIGLGFAVSAVAAETVATNSQLDLAAVAQSISDTLRAHVYDPAVLSSDRYATVERETGKLAAQATSSDEFISQFNDLWQQGPFSHVRLTPARQSADQLARYLDTMNAGEGAAALEWRGDTAVLNERASSQAWPLTRPRPWRPRWIWPPRPLAARGESLG